MSARTVCHFMNPKNVRRLECTKVAQSLPENLG